MTRDRHRLRMPVPGRVRAAATAAVLLISLTGCTSTPQAAPTQAATTFQNGVLAPEKDSGAAGDRAAVRQAVVAALGEEHQAFVISPRLRGKKPAEILAAVTTPAAARARLALLVRARSKTLAAGLQRSFSFYAHQDFGPNWSGQGSRDAWLDRDVWATTSFHVDHWQGVQVDRDTARVLVRGENRGTTWGGTPARDAWAQYKILLHRDPTAPNGWRITHQQAASTAA